MHRRSSRTAAGSVRIRIAVGLVAGALLGSALLAMPKSQAHRAWPVLGAAPVPVAASPPVIDLSAPGLETIPPALPPRAGDETGPPHSPPAPAVAISAEDAPPPLPVARRSRIPILMYHEIGDGDSSLFVRVTELEAQLDYLVNSGYQTISMDQAYRHLFEGRPLPAKPVVITFDDAYATFYTIAYPALRHRNQTATLFVPTSLVGQWQYVTWDQIREMDRGGMDIQAHSATHPDLSRLSGEALTREVTGSGRTLTEQLGHPVAHFAYPAGRYNQAAKMALKDAGFLTGVTTLPGGAGPEQDALELRRVRISRGQSVAGFSQQLATAALPPVQR